MPFFMFYGHQFRYYMKTAAKILLFIDLTERMSDSSNQIVLFLKIAKPMSVRTTRIVSSISIPE